MAIITPLKTAAEQQLAEQFANIKAELPCAGAMRKVREDAFAGFEAKGLPPRRLESWRYTDLRNLVRQFRLGLPMGAMAAADLFGLSLFQLMQVRLSQVEGAASQITLMLTSVAYMPGIGIARRNSP